METATELTSFTVRYKHLWDRLTRPKEFRLKDRVFVVFRPVPKGPRYDFLGCGPEGATISSIKKEAGGDIRIEFKQPAHEMFDDVFITRSVLLNEIESISLTKS